MRSAAELDFNKDYPSFPEFAQHRLPLRLINANLIITLQCLRGLTGIPIYPSPDPRGWARIDGSKTSRHYAVGRLSDAGDIFPARGKFLELFFKIPEASNIGGVGIYADTKGLDGNPWPMLHIDLRPHGMRVMWARDKSYYMLGQKGYIETLQKIIDMDKDA